MNGRPTGTRHGSVKSSGFVDPEMVVLLVVSNFGVIVILLLRLRSFSTINDFLVLS